MATYKSDAGAILTPGNQINKLSAFNHEGVLGWPGIELFEQIGFVKVCLLYTSPSPRDCKTSRMPSSA